MATDEDAVTANAVMAPELVMPPEKVEIMTDAAVPVETLASPPTRMP